MVDNRGTTLQIGQEVAYNLCGQIAKGIIVDYKKFVGRKEGLTVVRTRPPIRIELQHEAAGLKAGHISKIKDPLSLLVLFEDEK